MQGLEHLPPNVSMSSDPMLDGLFRVTGWANGWPIIEWIKPHKHKVEMPMEFDFLNAFYPNNEQAREYFKR